LTPFKFTSIFFVILLIILDAAYLAGMIDWWWILVLFLLYLHLLVLGSIYIRWNFYLRSYCKGTDAKLIALTFDDGPANETDAILDILKQYNVQACFFVIGKNAAEHSALLDRINKEGHAVGNHSYGHGFNFDWQTAAKMSAEIGKTNNTIAEVIGKKPKLFRPPYGVTNPNLAKAVKTTGMHSIGWSVRSFDTKAKEPAKLLNRILTKLEGGDIILLHDSMQITREILTEFIIKAREKGFTFARIDKLLEIDAYA
jgi:peptidoglycan/xylan/chitin deacetylase (PgdA/CDA1 family)